MLGRIARMCRAYPFSDFSPVKLEDIQFEHLGSCIRLTVDEFETNIVSKANESSKNAIIHVGSTSETETLELFDKAVDALNSVRSAQKSGVVAGGGITYLRISQLLESFKHDNEDVEQGVKCIALALKQPLKKLMQLRQMPYL